MSKKGKRLSKRVSGDATKAKSEVAATSEKTKTVKTVQVHKTVEEQKVNTAGLPESVLKHKIIGKSTVSEGVQKITIADVTHTSRTIYVNDIHSANPVTLVEHFWIGCVGQRWPIVRVEKDDYEFVLKHTKGRLPKNSHIVCVVDCAIDPTLSYGFYLDDLPPNGFPTLDQIKAKDAEFRKNPTTIHNQSVRLEIVDKDQLETQAEEELMEFSDDDEEITKQEEADDEEGFVFDD